MNQDNELQQRAIDSVMTVLTPMISGDPLLYVQMWQERYIEDPDVLVQGFTMVAGWLLNELDKAGVDRRECLQAFAAEGAGRFTGL